MVLLPTFRLIVYQPIIPSLKSHQCLTVAHFVAVTLRYPQDTKIALTRASEARTQVSDVRNTGSLNLRSPCLAENWTTYLLTQ